ncbi:MAG: endolytic transglycosylase MltG [Lachnospiraceae bacterium]|nr:endolytic transglycosylase MltG [Lachnospiraceae bacterium]
MKISYFLRGLGVGIIFCAIIMLVGYSSNNKAEMTDEEIISKAKQLGLVEAGTSDESIDALFDDSSKDANDASNDDKDTKEDSSEDSKEDSSKESTEEATETETTEEVSEEEATTEEATTEEATTEEAKKEKKNNKKTEKKKSSDNKDITIVINNGMCSEDFAVLLANYGIVDDAHKFNQYLCNNNNYAKRLQPGTYTFKQGTDYATIAVKVTE